MSPASTFVLALAIASALASERVHIRDVSALTFAAGKMTEQHRGSPVPQLACRGGSGARYASEVRTAHCRNIGWDGGQVVWECETQLPPGLQLGPFDVVCEGWRPGDTEYVGSGTCQLEYELVGAPLRPREPRSPPKPKPEQATLHELPPEAEPRLKPRSQPDLPFIAAEITFVTMVSILGLVTCLVCCCTLCGSNERPRPLSAPTRRPPVPAQPPKASPGALHRRKESVHAVREQTGHSTEALLAAGAVAGAAGYAMGRSSAPPREPRIWNDEPVRASTRRRQPVLSPEPHRVPSQVEPAPVQQMSRASGGTRIRDALQASRPPPKPRTPSPPPKPRSPSPPPSKSYGGTRTREPDSSWAGWGSGSNDSGSSWWGSRKTDDDTSTSRATGGTRTR